MTCRRAARLLAAAALLLTAGCANPTHLIFYQSSIVGVDVATSADTGTVHAVLGYDRQTGTVIPKTTVTPDDAASATTEREAMAVVSRARIRVEWLRATEICERFATGKAAVNLARQGATHALKTDGTPALGPAVCEGF